MTTPGQADDANHPDQLRSVEQLCLPDSRMQHQAVREGGTSRRLEQMDRHASISQFELHPDVPNDVRVHFDTARNLYLYAWFVYRFHVVAEQQALASLEMALRKCLIARSLLNAEGLVVTKISTKVVGGSRRERGQQPGLRWLLQLAVDHALVHNDRFANRAQWAQTMANHRLSVEQINYMAANGLTEMAVTDEPARPTESELTHDWIAVFVETLPSIRNTYAHGSSMLHASVLRTFDVVSDLINQLFTSRGTTEIQAPGTNDAQLTATRASPLG